MVLNAVGERGGKFLRENLKVSNKCKLNGKQVRVRWKFVVFFISC